MSNQNQNPGQQNQNPNQKPGQQQGGGQKPGQQQQDPNRQGQQPRNRIASSKVNQARAGKSRRKAGFFFWSGFRMASRTNGDCR